VGSPAWGGLRLVKQTALGYLKYCGPSLARGLQSLLTLLFQPYLRVPGGLGGGQELLVPKASLEQKSLQASTLAPSLVGCMGALKGFS
jgi:hypothetical protein